MGTAGKGAWVVPAPAYREVEGWEGAGDDSPGFRCGHSLTVVAPTKGHGPRLILFGGATAIEAGASSGMPGISTVLFFFFFEVSRASCLLELFSSLYLPL